MFCNRCGTRLQQGTAICPECGARQHRQTRDIRCARCGGRASVEMAVCPHCGRNLVPAGPRWALWIPLALIVAFAVYWGWGKLPIRQVKQEAAAAQAKLSGLVQIPDLATPTATPTPGSGIARSAQPSPTATRTPTPTPTRPPTATATATPVPSAAPTSGPTEYVVVSGDSLALIGDKLDLPWQTIAEINGINQNTMIRPGDKLRLPTSTPVPTRPAATAAAAPSAAVTNSASPTLSASPEEATVRPTSVPTNTPTSAPTAPPAETASPPTVTPRPIATPAPTPTPAPTNTPAPSLSAPVLLMPGDRNASTGDGTQIVLQWQTKDSLPLGTVYRVIITDKEQGVLVSRPFYWTTTSFPVPSWLWGLADQPNREYQWFVQVVQLATDGKGGERVIELSPPSETRTLFWN